MQPSLAVPQQTSSAGAYAQPPLAPTAFAPARVIDLADLPKGMMPPDGFRTSSEGKCIPEKCDTDSNYARRLRFVDPETGEVLSQPTIDSAYALECRERFEGVTKAIEDASTDGSDRSSEHSSDASDYCHRCRGGHDCGSAAIMNKDPKFRVCVDCATDWELLDWGHEQELKDRKELEEWNKTNVSAEEAEAEARERVVPMGDVVTDPRAVQVFLAGVNNSKKRARADEDEAVDRAYAPVAAHYEQQNKLARIEATALEPPADPESEPEEDEVPGTPAGAVPYVVPYAAPGSSIVPHRQPAADGPTWAQRAADPNYVPESPPLRPASPASVAVIVPESPLGAGAAAA